MARRKKTYFSWNGCLWVGMLWCGVLRSWLEKVEEDLVMERLVALDFGRVMNFVVDQQCWDDIVHF